MKVTAATWMGATRTGTIETRRGTGVSCGTFGELLQGAMAQPEEDFLVTLPIGRRSTAQVTLFPDVAELFVDPVHKQKSALVAHLALRWCGARFGGILEITSDLPEGKGMASSTADLVATVRAVGAALGRPVSPREIELLLRDIEPTDGVMYDGIVAFHHRKVTLGRVLGPAPALTIVGVDEGGQIDTVDFNVSRAAITPAERREYETLLDDLSRALPRGDLHTVGRVATRSAQLNQRRCEKRLIDTMIGISSETQALGVVVAHSGTMVGILVSRDDPCHDARVADVRAACESLGVPVSIDRTPCASPPTC